MPFKDKEKKREYLKNRYITVESVGQKLCECGCGETIPAFIRGKPRRVKKGHYPKNITYGTRLCCDCNIEFIRFSPFAKRCVDCRRKAKTNYHKRYRKGERWQRWSKGHYEKNKMSYLNKSFIRVCKLREQLFHILDQHMCVYCGYFDKMALVFDHIQNGGNKERKTLNLRGNTSFYYYVNKPDYARERLQVLCCNCNEIKRRRMYR